MYTSIVGGFLNSIQALKFYVDSVEPVNSGEENIDENTFLATMMLLTRKLKINNIKFEDIEFEDNAPEELLEISRKLIEELQKGLEVSKDGKTARYKNLPKDIKESYRKIEAMQKQNEILYSGSLMLLITYFETTISKILKSDFQRHPERMSLETKTVPYRILELSGSIADVKNILIDEEVMKMMYKSVSDWIEYFKKNLKLKLEYPTKKLPNLIEIIARRNLMVHNEGCVNNIYLGIVNKEQRSGVKKGDVLVVDKEYISNAIDLVECIGMAIIIEIWLNECAKNEDEIKKIMAIIYEEYLIFEKWEEAKVLYEICLQYKKLQVADALICKINRWQCYKWSGEFEKVRKEVEELDVSAMLPRYKLGILALLEKYDDFFVYFDKQNDLTKEELEEWPLFRKIRNCQEYIQKFEKQENE